MILAAVFLPISGCAVKFIPMYNLKDQPISPGLSEEQVKKAIVRAAVTSGWQIVELEPGRLVGTLQVRTHKIIVDIPYSTENYSIEYKNSIEMKVYCNASDKENQFVTVTDGNPKTCFPGPQFIHINYQKWVDILKQAIEIALPS